MNEPSSQSQQPSNQTQKQTDKQVTTQPRETHLQTFSNEVEWNPRADQEGASHTDNIPGSPGFNGARSGVRASSDQQDQDKGVDVASHALDEVPTPDKGSIESGYKPIEPQQQG